MHNARNRVVLGGTCDVVMLVGRSVDDGRGRRGDVRVGIAGSSGGREEGEEERERERERAAASRRHGVCAATRSRASSLNETSWPPRGNTRAPLFLYPRPLCISFTGGNGVPPFSRL